MSNTWIIYLRIGDNLPKGELIPNKTTSSHEGVVKNGDSALISQEINVGPVV